MATPDTASTAAATGESPIERAFRMLQVIVAAGESIGVRELGRRTGLPRSTVSRLVGTLGELGMVARTADGAVLPGSALATLQPAAGATPLLEDRLRPLLAELVQTFGENAALSIDDGDQLLYLSQVSSDHAVSVPDVTGEHHDFHLVAPGLLTMAWWPDERLDAILASPLTQATEQSWVDADQLRARLTTIRADGFCWTDQELDVGVNGLAVGIVDDDQLVATVSLFGPAYRLNPDTRPSAATDLTAMVRERASSLF